MPMALLKRLDFGVRGEMSRVLYSGRFEDQGPQGGDFCEEDTAIFGIIGLCEAKWHQRSLMGCLVQYPLNFYFDLQHCSIVW